MSHEITFQPSGRGKAQCSADPAYPHGVEIDAAKPGEKACCVELPYPAPECGVFLVSCRDCLMNVAITAAGRADDPINVRIPCKVQFYVAASEGDAG